MIFSLSLVRSGLALCLACFLVSACAATPEETYVEKPVEELYNDAMGYMEKEEYQRAAKAFDEVERQHPYSLWATKAQLMSGYSYYQGNKYDDAILALDRFIQLHPSSRDVAYAYYLKALSYYEQISDVGRDQKMTLDALRSLAEVVDRFPESKYARDAKLKIDLARDHLAGREMTVGRQYQRQKQYLAAIGRFRIVIDHYQTTSHTPEALHRLAECYTALGMDQEAQRTAAVLGHNFPGSSWYKDSYELANPQKLPKEKASWRDWVE